MRNPLAQPAIENTTRLIASRVDAFVLQSNNITIGHSLIEFLSGGGQRGIALIEAYLDESGAHRGSKILCVAGYAGIRSEWDAFEKEWRNQLAQFGISYFHAKSPKCDILKPYLVDVIKRRNLRGVVCSVSLDDFNTHAGSQFKSTLGNAYAVCAFMCGLEFAKWTKENNLGGLSLVLENGQPNIDFVERIFKSMMDDENSVIAGVAVARKVDFIPLQAADFLSHVCGVYDRSWFEILMQSGNVVHAHLTLEQIAETSQEIKKTIAQHRNLRRRKRL